METTSPLVGSVHYPNPSINSHTHKLHSPVTEYGNMYFIVSIFYIVIIKNVYISYKRYTKVHVCFTKLLLPMHSLIIPYPNFFVRYICGAPPKGGWELLTVLTHAILPQKYYNDAIY